VIVQRELFIFFIFEIDPRFLNKYDPLPLKEHHPVDLCSEQHFVFYQLQILPAECYFVDNALSPIKLKEFGLNILWGIVTVRDIPTERKHSDL